MILITGGIVLWGGTPKIRELARIWVRSHKQTTQAVQAYNQQSGIAANVVNAGAIINNTFNNNPPSAQQKSLLDYSQVITGVIVGLVLLAITAVPWSSIQNWFVPINPPSNEALVGALVSAAPQQIDSLKYSDLSEAQESIITASLVPYTKYKMHIMLYWVAGNTNAEKYGNQWASIFESVKKTEQSQWEFDNLHGIDSRADGIVIQTKYHPIKDTRISETTKIVANALYNVFHELKLSVDYGDDSRLNDEQMFVTIGKYKKTK